MAARDTSLATLAACLAGVRSVAAHASEATEAWSVAAVDPKPLALAIRGAEGALDRARSQVAGLRRVLPGHARRVRLAERAVERAERALAAIRALPPVQQPGADEEAQEEAADADAEALALAERAIAAVGRAVEAAVAR